VICDEEADEGYNPNSVDAEHRRSLEKSEEDSLKKKADAGDESAKKRLQALKAHKVAKERITLDPGIGFGKTVAQNFELLAQQSQLSSLGYPLLVGWSRKSSLGAVTGCDADQRLVPSVAAALLAVERGAQVLRVHDVEATVQALSVWQHAQLGSSTLRQ
jgi:dihydropteroate synthase